MTVDNSFDSIDKEVIRILSERGRATWAELAEHLKLSPPAAADRVRKLEERGVIRGYAALLDAEAIGKPLTAFIAVALTDHGKRKRFLDVIGELNAVEECHHVAGEHDFFLKVRCGSTRELDRILTEELKGRAGAGRTQTTIVLTTQKEQPVRL
ncbi:MAG: Lrp/AsnC family transcriptional regulator [Acidobacteria bacterium]|nr:Lrp/AsnC family transcriptional regulator [Acidobacteriota bacterium]